jgi:hypothetical protein
MDFIWLHRPSHDGSIPQKVRQTLHIGRIEHVYFKVKSPTNMISIHGNALAQSDPGDIDVIPRIMRISPIRDCH